VTLLRLKDVYKDGPLRTAESANAVMWKCQRFLS
jgi:hypothetical protein